MTTRSRPYHGSKPRYVPPSGPTFYSGYSSSDDESSGSQSESPAVDFAFAFDIDGVLLRGGEVLPEGIKALNYLNGNNPRGLHIPYIFVTNGGGKTEQERCNQLSKQLQTPVSPEQFICGHTPMRSLASRFRTVLVVGGEGEACRRVAETYGFQDIVTPGDIMKWKSSVTPFRRLAPNDLAHSKRRNFAKINIEAIFVFADSRHWGDDAQIILELLMSDNGRMETAKEGIREPAVPLFFAHDDFVWRTEYGLNRLGMGAFRCMIEGLWMKMTGRELRCTSFGKPAVGTFRCAAKVLDTWRQETGCQGPPRTVYFVGDTPESDIQGTNIYNAEVHEEWYSILVRTGVYKPGTAPNFQPQTTVDTVFDAVKHGFERSCSMMDDE